MSEKKLVYGINDRPSLPIMVLAGAQHVLTLFGATTLVPLIFGPAMGMDSLQIGFFISCVYLGMGFATLVQISPLGSGLPIVQGSSLSFIPPVMTIIGIYGYQGANVVMQYLSGSLIVGGIVMALVGYSGLVGKIRRFIGPITMGPTIMAIGFSLAPIAVAQNAALYWPASLSVVLLIFIFSLVIRRQYLGIFSILLSISLVYLFCFVLSVTHVIQPGHPVFINLDTVKEAHWFQWTGVFPWGAPKVSLVSMGAVVAGFFSVLIESLGDYFNVSNACGLKDPSAHTINKGIGAEGFGCVIGGLSGAVACTSYTENIGLISLTGVASRWVVGTGAVLLIIMSFIGKLGALVATVPQPIIGGCYIALFGCIGSLGIQALGRADMKSQRNVMIVGFSFLLALGLPGWVSEHQEMFFSWGMIGQILWALGKTAMAVAGLSSCILDNLIPGTDKERGLIQG